MPVGVGSELAVGQLFHQVERFVEIGLDLVEVAGRSFEPAREEQTRRPLFRCDERAGRPERASYAPGSGDAVAVHDPGPAEPGRDADPEPLVVPGGPGEGGVDIGPLCPYDGKALGLAFAAYGRVAAISGLREPRGVCRARVVHEAGLAETVEREVPDAVEQPVAHRAL